MDEFIEKNLPLVQYTINRYCRQMMEYSTIEREDLFQVGCIGLINAARNYDPKISKWSTYAVSMILGTIRQYYRDQKFSLKVPRSLHKANAIFKAIEDLYPNLSDTEKRKKAREWGAAEWTLQYQNKNLAPFSYHDGDDFFVYLETLGTEEDFTQVEIDDFFESLEGREGELLRLRYMKELTQVEISKRIGLSQAQVCRLLKRSSERLKDLVG